VTCAVMKGALLVDGAPPLACRVSFTKSGALNQANGAHSLTFPLTPALPPLPACGTLRSLRILQVQYPTPLLCTQKLHCTLG